MTDGFSLAGRSDDPFDSRNIKPRLGTYILLFFLLILWPIGNYLVLSLSDTDINLTNLDPVWFIYLPTIFIQWFMFLAITLGIIREHVQADEQFSLPEERSFLAEQGEYSSTVARRGLRYFLDVFRTIGFVRPKWGDLGKGILFLISANLILTGLQAGLDQIGLPVSKEVNEMVRQAAGKVWWWLAVSLTAGICEETVFRGYLLTRLKKVIGRGWFLPVFLAAFSFGAGHTYQGWGGLILIFIYGIMFCGLFIYSRSIWPGIFAHFIQDFSAIFIYKFFGF